MVVLVCCCPASKRFSRTEGENNTVHSVWNGWLGICVLCINAPLSQTGVMLIILLVIILMITNKEVGEVDKT